MLQTNCSNVFRFYRFIYAFICAFQQAIYFMCLLGFEIFIWSVNFERLLHNDIFIDIYPLIWMLSFFISNVYSTRLFVIPILLYMTNVHTAAHAQINSFLIRFYWISDLFKEILMMFSTNSKRKICKTKFGLKIDILFEFKWQTKNMIFKFSTESNAYRCSRICSNRLNYLEITIVADVSVVGLNKEKLIINKSSTK